MIGMDSSFGRSGVHDWWMQRISAVFLLLYLIFISYQVITVAEFSYQTWSGIFAPLWVQVFTFISVVAISIHAWAGLWIVSTDYLKPPLLRNLFQLIVLSACLGFIVWAAIIFWG
jgi:succinate dehydrogenase / fumarate reductase membrane anchor subunit